MNLLPQIRDILARLNIHADPEGFVIVFTLIMARMGSALRFIPFLGGESVQSSVQVGWTILVAVVLYPVLSAQLGGSPPPQLGTYLALLLKEILVGVLIGLFVQILFAAVEAAGSFIEFTAGLRPEQIQAPQVPSATGPLSRLLGQAAIAIYLTAGVHYVFLRALADTYRIVPLFTLPAFRSGFLPLAIFAGRISAGFVVAAFQLSAPVILVLALVKIGANLVFRASFAGIKSDPLQPFSTFAAYGLLFLGAGLFGEEIVRLAGYYLTQVQQFVLGIP